jgi:hypothetical protein
MIILVLLFRAFTKDTGVTPVVAGFFGVFFLLTLIDLIRRIKNGGARNRRGTLKGFWPQISAGIFVMVLSVLVGGVFIDQQIQLDRNGVDELSTVETMRRDTGRRSRGYDVYVRTDNTEEQVKLNLNSSIGRTLEAGDTLLIRHVPGKPSYAVLAQNNSAQSLLLVLSIAGLFFAVGIFLIYKAYKEKSK